MEEERMYGKIVNQNEGVQIFYDENCKENEKEGEWNISSKFGGLDF